MGAKGNSLSENGRLSLSIATYKNTILKHLDAESIERLHLCPVTLELLHEMEFPGSTINNLFFIEEGIGSITVTLNDGAQVEAGMFGYESVVGVSALMGVRRSLNRVYMQVAGRGYSCATDLARKEFDRGERFHDLALRCVQAQLTQSMQSAACNAKHNVEQRLARWLLTCVDRTNRTAYSISHEVLAEMLGTTRPSVSIAAGILKHEGMIEYSRGAVRILDVKGLEAKACECYQVVKSHLDDVANFDTGYVI